MFSSPLNVATAELPLVAAPRPRFLDRPHLAPFVIALVTTALFHAIVAATRPAYWTTAPVWDENFYLTIAREGYVLRDGDFGRYSALPFSPGMGLLLRGLGIVTQLPPIVLRAPTAAVLFVAGLLLLAWALRAFSPDVRRNNLALLVFAVWPGSLYFRSGYAEALYFPLLAAFFGCLLRRRWLPAALLVAACLFTRTTALVLVGTLAVAVVLDAFATRGFWQAALRSGLRLLWTIPVAMLGLLGYMVMLQVQVGDASGFRRAYLAWGPCEVLAPRRLELKSVVDALHAPHATVKLSLLSYLLMPLVVWPQRCRMPAVLTAFAFGAWLFFLSQDWLAAPFHDMLRWLAPVFPFHYALVTMCERLRRPWYGIALTGWVAVSTVTYAWCVWRYVRHDWVS